MSGMYQDGKCTRINCPNDATLALVLEVEGGGGAYHRPFTFLSKVGYCDKDFGFFYRALSGADRTTLVEVKILRPHGVDSDGNPW